MRLTFVEAGERFGERNLPVHVLQFKSEVVMDSRDAARARRIAELCISKLSLNLTGLTVYTEAASGPYLFTPLIAAFAGASRVYAVACDSKFGSISEVTANTLHVARSWGIEDRVMVLSQKNAADVAQSDIVMNAGFVRPITRELVFAMKPTAVIPLMWETWEFRPHELDLTACRERGIVVLGTNEGSEDFNLYPSTGFLAVKLLYEMGFEVFWTRIILLGGKLGMGRSVADHFRSLGISFEWFANDEPVARPYEQLPEFIDRRGCEYDVLLLAEHHDNRLLIGDGGLLTYDQIRRSNPTLELAVIAGNVCSRGLVTSQVKFYPGEVKPFGYLSYPGFKLGPLTPLALFAMGLKVGEVTSRARLAGLSPKESVVVALKDSPAMDFEGDLSWI